MNWQQWLQGLGFNIPASPDMNGIVVAIVLVAGAYWIGWFAANRLGGRLARGVMRWIGRSEGVSERLVGSIVQHGLAALLLLIVSNASMLSPLGNLMVAVAFGAAGAMLIFRLGQSSGFGGITSLVVAAIALVAGTAAILGGLHPLIAGLDGIGFSLGTHHLSLLGLVNFILVAAILVSLARVANRVLAHSVGRMQALDGSQRVLVQKLGGIAVITVAILLGIDLLGIDLTALTVFSGAFGLAVGFGLQKTFGNLIAGLILLMDRSIKPGDVIVVGDTFGAVGKIGVRAVSVVTRDGKEHLIPNEQLMTEPVENWSYSNRNVRVHVPVGVAYSSDLRVAQRLMIEAASAAARVLAEPKPSVWLKGFGDSSVDHDILVWIADPELGVGNIRSDILNRLWDLFADNGIEIPFPQRDVTIRGLPAGFTSPGSQRAAPDGQ